MVYTTEIIITIVRLFRTGVQAYVMVIVMIQQQQQSFTALCLGLPGWAGTRRNTHPPTILIIIQSLSASSMYYDPQHPPSSNCVLGNLFAQPLPTSPLVYLLVWNPPPHIPYISLPNQCLLFCFLFYLHTHTEMQNI